MLVIADRGGIEIDYCPTCRGVWLDRGELDKLIERQTQVMQQTRPESLPGYQEAWGPQTPARPEPRRSGYDDDDDDYRKHGKRKRRRPFDLLEDIFDF